MFTYPLTIKKIIEGYEKKTFSSKEVFAHFYGSIKAKEKSVNSFLTVLDENKLSVGEKSIPIAHKDIFSTKGIETTAGSNILKGYISPYDATSVERLKGKNFVCIGKTNCDAFAHGATGENSDFGPTLNPYDLTRVAGGSSSGSCASVSAGFTPVATATDTGGSIRLPASFTNTVGLKPTYGRVSRYGVIAMTSSTDSIGHVTKTVWDSAFVLGITAGFDPKDATSSREKVSDYLSEIDRGIKGLIIGVPKEYLVSLDKGVAETFQKALKVLEKLGAKIVEVSLPTTEYAINAYYIITPSEVSSNLARFDAIRFGKGRESFGAEAKRRIMMGTYCLSSGYYDAYYLKAQKVRTLIIREFAEVFKQVDILVAPVSPILPPKLGYAEEDPIKAYMMDVLTVPINMAGLPALSVPAGFIQNLPVGIQFIGKQFDESTLFSVGKAFEDETELYKIAPEL